MAGALAVIVALAGTTWVSRDYIGAHWRSWPWGTIWSAVAALSTVVAAGFAAWIGYRQTVITQRLLSLEHDRSAEERRESCSITAWRVTESLWRVEIAVHTRSSVRIAFAVGYDTAQAWGIAERRCRQRLR